VIIRPLQHTDLPAILGIERSAMSAPWNDAQLRAETEAGNGIALAAECDGQVCAYAFFRTCLPECELLHLVVAPQWRRRGVANALLQRALADFSGQGYATCFLEVRNSNTAARHLYDKSGFHQVGTRKEYYSQPVEDALLMCTHFLDKERRTS
jgi:[ribosomal protein S18]-alanine N-acetyltransferase